MKYTTVVFDLDGTLIDSQPGITYSMKKALHQYGIEESEQTIAGLIGPPLSKTILVRYNLTEERRNEIMKTFYGIQLSEALDRVSIYDGVCEMLDRLRKAGLKVAIATNKPETVFKAQFALFPEMLPFDAIEHNNDPQTRGTKSQFIQWAMETCGAKPEQTVMVGDRFNDLQGGVDNHTDTIGVTYGYGSEEEIENCHPTFVAHSAKEVADWILGQ